MVERPELEDHLREIRGRGAKILVPYVMAGVDDQWLDTIAAVVDAGADAVEVGIPFSDPIMDGPVIQEASVRALARRTTPDSVLDGLARLSIGVPIVVMTYYNLALHAGVERFAHQLARARVGGAILADLSFEEVGPWASAADESGVATVLLVAPSTGEERVERLCARSKGFVYAVARMGVTGEQAALSDAADSVVAKIRRATDTPVLIGVGVSTPEQAATACQAADGVIVGSALVRRILQGEGTEGAQRFVATLRAGIDASD